ncbi:MAG: hypothetical protein ACYTG3_19510 [Planctomycetota bacterium]|jgi:hypothetical protein
MPRPPKSWIAFLALLPAAFLVGRLSFAQEDSSLPKPHRVKALRYTILWADSAMDLSHGGGRWVQEIYFPQEKVACTLVFQAPTILAKAAPRLYAFPADRPRNDLTGLKNPRPSVIEEIEVPAEVAQEIFKLAELTRRQEREAWRMGKVVAARGLMRELPRAEDPGSK